MPGHQASIVDVIFRGGMPSGFMLYSNKLSIHNKNTIAEFMAYCEYIQHANSVVIYLHTDSQVFSHQLRRTLTTT